MRTSVPLTGFFRRLFKHPKGRLSAYFAPFSVHLNVHLDATFQQAIARLIKASYRKSSTKKGYQKQFATIFAINLIARLLSRNASDARRPRDRVTPCRSYSEPKNSTPLKTELQRTFGLEEREREREKFSMFYTFNGLTANCQSLRPVNRKQPICR